MQAEAVTNLIGTLQACRHSKDLHQAKRLHGFMRQQQLESHPVLGNFLIPMLVDCGSLPDAHHVFDLLPCRSEHSWTSLISGYVDRGEHCHAFDLYCRMQDESGAQPNGHTYLALLNACARTTDAETGSGLHVETTKRGLDTELFVGSALVNMYSKCGLLAEARHVLDKLDNRDSFSWNALIEGYAECGLGDMVLNCLSHMQLEGLSADPVTFVCSLKATGTVAAMEQGRKLHAETTKRGFERDVIVGSTLVDMYTKCGSLVEGRQVFDRLPSRSIVSWNSLITGYADHGLGEEASNCFFEMQLDGISPDSVSFICSLRACGTVRALETGQKLHTETIKSGLEGDLHVGSTLLDMYTKCGLLADAHQVFDWLPVRNAVSWNALVAGYTEHGLGEEAVKLFHLAQCDQIAPDCVTFLCGLKACGLIGALDTGYEIHSEIIKRALERGVYVGNTLVVVYAKCGLLGEAHEMLEQLSVQDVVSWNALITGYAENGLQEEVLNCFHEMKLRGLCADAVTFACSLKACGIMGVLEAGQDVYADITKRGLEMELHVGSALVDMYGRSGLLPEAQNVFNGLLVRDAISWKAMIAGYSKYGLGEEVLNCFKEMQDKGLSLDAGTFLCGLKSCVSIDSIQTGQQLHAVITKWGLERELCVGSKVVCMYSKCGLLADARRVFDQLPVQDAVSWNAVIAGYAEFGFNKELLCCFRQMQIQGIATDAVTYLCTLKACGDVGDLETGQEVHAEITKKGLERDLHVGSSLVDMYSKAGLLKEAHKVFERLPDRNTVSLNALVAGYAEHGFGKEVVNCVKKMQLEGISPDAVTFILCLKACGIIGDIEKGREIHADINISGLEGDLFVGNMLIDMYGKCGSVGEGQKVFDHLAVQDVISWNALINGYAEHGFIKEAVACFQQMQVEGICPNSVTFMCSLKACSTVGGLEAGWKLHAEIMKRGLETEACIGNMLVDLYATCGLLAEARQVLDQLPFQDAISWNALIAGYAEYGLHEELMNSFRQLQLKGVSLDAVTFVHGLKVCASVRALETGHELHAVIINKGMERELCVGGSLVDMYSKCGCLKEAQRVLEVLPVGNAVSWNALIAGYSNYGHTEDVLACFKQMQLDGVPANAVTFLLCMKACGTMGALDKGREIHAEVRKSGYERDISVGNMLIDMYGKCGSVSEGREVFDMLPSQDVITWTAMIKAYGENHEGDMAVQCFEEMQEQGVKPDAVTFLCLLAACSHASLVLKGQEYFKLMIEHYNIEATSDHYACMVDLFARSGHVYEAERFLAAMKCPPSSFILTDLLSTCKVYGKVELGHTCFGQLMNEKDASAYLLMGDIYAGAGRLSDASRVEEMRKIIGKRKKAGSALTEVNKDVHEFIVGVNQDNHIFEMLNFLNSCMKSEGYVPNTYISSKYTANADEVACDRFVDKHSSSLTCFDNIVSYTQFRLCGDL